MHVEVAVDSLIPQTGLITSPGQLGALAGQNIAVREQYSVAPVNRRPASRAAPVPLGDDPARVRESFSTHGALDRSPLATRRRALTLQRPYLPILSA